MSQNSKQIKNRRQFLKDGLRSVVFGGITFTGLFLWWRGHSRPEGELSFLPNIPCNDCLILNVCPDPRAISAREQQGEPVTGNPGTESGA